MGSFTYTGCFLSDRVTAIASVSGLMWNETRNNCNANHPTAVLTLHGTRDNDRPYDGYPGYMMSIDEINEYWNDHNEITDGGTTTDFEDSGLTIERTDFTGGEGDVMVTHYKFVRGGHDWFDFEDEGEDTGSIIGASCPGLIKRLERPGHMRAQPGISKTPMTLAMFAMGSGYGPSVGSQHLDNKT